MIWTDSFDSGQRQVRASCVYGNEHSVSMKCSEYFDELRKISTSEKVHCSIELVKAGCCERGNELSRSMKGAEYPD
jgi:hypothetical protein